MITKEIQTIKNKKPVIAIDGHSSSGKSTLAKDLSKALEIPYVDTGAMYRAVTLYLLEHCLAWNDPEHISAALEDIQLRFVMKRQECYILLNDENVSKEIRTMRVSDHVSDVAAVSVVRRAMVRQQREMAHENGIIMDGRDIGTVVFPDAPVKLFVTASIDTRTERRYQELLVRGVTIEKDQVKENLLHRDHIDSTRKDSPLKKADDAISMDTSELDRNAMFMASIQLIIKRLKDLD